MALDYEKIASEIAEKAGDKENVVSVSHCMTRIRLVVRDIKKADQESIKNIEGVLGVTYQGGQLQVIMGKNLIPVYDILVKRGFKDEGEIDENLDPNIGHDETKNIGQRIIEYVAGSVTPVIPGLIAGGMLKVFLLLLSRTMPSFAEGSTYTMFSIVADAPFYFMPIFIAYGASRKLGATPIYSMIVAGAMFGPSFQSLITAGEPVTMFGIQVALRSYASSLLPALLLAYVAYWTEKGLNKVVPGVLKSILVGMGTLAVTYFVTMSVLAPLGAFIGQYLVVFIMWLYKYAGPVALFVLAGLMPYVIMTGMHTVFGPFMVQLLSEQGYDPIFRPALLLHNMSEGGAMLGIALRAKNKHVKSEAFSLAIACIFAGVTEPSIYGYTLPLKKPLWAVSIGGGVGGLIAAILGARNYEMGYSTILALPIFEDTIVAMAIAIGVTIAVSCIMTILFGFDQSVAEKNIR